MASSKSFASEQSVATAKAAPLGAGKSLTALTLERVPPNSPDAEMGVLGCILISPQDAGSQARERLEEKHFYIAANQVIFREMAAMQDAMQAVDLITLTQRLQDKEVLEEIGGPVYLTDLLNRVPTATNIDQYIEIVYEKYLLRQLIGAAHDIMMRAFDTQDNVQGWINEAEQQIFSITAEKAATTARPVGSLIKDAMHAIEQLYESKGMTGLATGFRDLDKLTGGLHPGNVFVIAARPSMGKTSLAMNIAENVAIDNGRPVGVFSLEMSGEELVKRMLCSRARANLRALHDGFLRESKFNDLTNAASELMKAPLYIDDTAGLTINQVRSRARRMRLQHKIELVVIDYLQLMRAPSRRADSSRQVEITDISAGVKAMAKELEIPVIVLSQLNRQPEAREDGKPKLSDLRESGSIEQDADLVGLLVRPEVYADDKEDRDQKKGKATLFIAKSRNGPTGDVEMTFLNECTRFEDASKISDADLPDGERGEE